MTYGEEAVASFNPSDSQNAEVEKCKAEFAAVIDRMDKLGGRSNSSAEVRRMCSVAITNAQTAQMWAVKAITWQD